MGVKVTFKDKGLTGLVAEFATLEDFDLTVGVQGATGAKVVRRGRDRLGRFSSSGSTNLASIALFNEFGTEHIPARPFIRSALATNKGAIQQAVAKSYARFVTEKTVTAVGALTMVGQVIASKVKDRIDRSQQWAKANAPGTVLSKGSSKPLHDTGRLAKSITWAVRRDGSIVSEGPAR